MFRRLEALRPSFISPALESREVTYVVIICPPSELRIGGCCSDVTVISLRSSISVRSRVGPPTHLSFFLFDASMLCMVMQIATALRTGLHSVPALELGLDVPILITQHMSVVAES